MTTNPHHTQTAPAAPAAPATQATSTAATTKDTATSRAAAPARSRAGSGRRGPDALKVAEDTFTLLITGPAPLAVDGARVGHGLPARPVDLGELRSLLLAPGAGDGLKDAAWTELVCRARTGEAAWVIGCVGVALPGLRAIEARAMRSAPPGLAEDIVSELTTEFVAQLSRVDLDRPHVIERLLWWARKAALRARGRELRQHRLEPTSADWLTPAPLDGQPGPEAVLAEAVRVKVITAAAAELICATRLHGMALADYARQVGAAPKRLYSLRERAEARLTTAITQGHVLVTLIDGSQNPGR